MSLPKYINCKNEEIEHCEYYMHRDCKDSCAYYRYIGTDVTMDVKFLQNLEKLVMFLEVEETPEVEDE